MPVATTCDTVTSLAMKSASAPPSVPHVAPVQFATLSVNVLPTNPTFGCRSAETEVANPCENTAAPWAMPTFVLELVMMGRGVA